MQEQKLRKINQLSFCKRLIYYKLLYCSTYRTVINPFFRGGIRIHISTQNVILTFFFQTSENVRRWTRKSYQKYKPFNDQGYIKNALLLNLKKKHKFPRHQYEKKILNVNIMIQKQ